MTRDKETETTLFMVLLAAFQTVLHRYSGAVDVVVGSPIANRDRVELEGLIGFFVNNLVLRTDFSGDPAFVELLARVRGVTLEAYAHQDVPFERLVEQLRPQRDLSRHPLVSVMFALQSVPVPQLVLPGLRTRMLDLDDGIAKFDLSLVLVEQHGGVAGRFDYNTDLFDGATIDRLVGHFLTLLEAVAADPAQRVSALALVPLGEREQSLVVWNRTARPFAGEPGVHELVQQQTARTPDAVAVAHAGEHLTYRQLNERANRLAHHLRQLGVGPEVVVALCLQRGLDWVVACLAVLKAGGAYLPLEPAAPEARLRFMIADAGAAVLVVHDQTTPPPQAPVQVLRLDRDHDLIAAQPDVDPRPSCGLDNLAYVIYTSGSTGQPKGVMVPHAGLLNLIRWHLRRYGIGPSDRSTQIAAPSFDASVWEIWPPLVAGASLHIAMEDDRLRADRLLHWLAQQRITITFLPTPLAEEVLRLPLPSDLVLRTLLTGGDTLTTSPPSSAGFMLVNHYGPTEAAVVATAVAVQPQPGRIPPIGHPIDNTRVYLLDRNLQPVPIGIPGELHLAGDGLARGYLQRPDLTAQTFLPDPFSPHPGGRLYCTGDLARYLPDGNVQFLGRIDNQVKIRGLRIELGEIEAKLREHPAVHDAVVTVQTDPPTTRRLLAYITTHDQPPDEQTLRTHLRATLPDYMIPSVITPLPTLPLTPNGKIDKHALPQPSPPTPNPHQTPRNPVEREIAAIWTAVLGIDHINIHDDFFTLGGHSLLATQVLSRIRTTFGIDLPVGVLFQTPTVAGLARALHEREVIPGEVAAIGRLRQVVEGMSDLEVARLLAEKSGSLKEVRPT